MCCPISARLGHSVELLFRSSCGTNAFSSSVQEFVRDDPDKGTLHQGTALAHADDLFPRDGVHKFQKVRSSRDNVLREAILDWRLQIRHKSPIGLQFIKVVLKAWQRTEQFHSEWITAKERRDSDGRNPDGTRKPAHVFGHVYT